VLKFDLKIFVRQGEGALINILPRAQERPKPPMKLTRKFSKFISPNVKNGT